MVPSAAQASSAYQGNSTPLYCTNGNYSANYTVRWSNTTNHRISIDRVDFISAFNGLRRLNFVPLTGVEVTQGSTRIYWNLAPAGYNSPTAAFWWNQTWRTATQANPIKVSIGATSPGSGNTCGKVDSFWG